VYCPVQTTLRQWSDRRKKVSVPVFPSYIFLHVNAQESDAVLQDSGVLNYVYWLGKPAIIRDEEIEKLMAFLTENKDNSVEVLNYKPGEIVEIAFGPFKGHRGEIDQVKGGRMSVMIESLGMIVKVEIYSDKIIEVK